MAPVPEHSSVERRRGQACVYAAIFQKWLHWVTCKKKGKKEPGPILQANCAQLSPGFFLQTAPPTAVPPDLLSASNEP